MIQSPCKRSVCSFRTKKRSHFLNAKLNKFNCHSEPCSCVCLHICKKNVGQLLGQIGNRTGKQKTINYCRQIVHMLSSNASKTWAFRTLVPSMTCARRRSDQLVTDCYAPQLQRKWSITGSSLLFIEAHGLKQRTVHDHLCSRVSHPSSSGIPTVLHSGNASSPSKAYLPVLGRGDKKKKHFRNYLQDVQLS